MSTQTIREDREAATRHARRVRSDDRAWSRFCARSDRAEVMIGELVREGRAVYYIFLGRKYREGSRVELIDFILRNNYA